MGIWDQRLLFYFSIFSSLKRDSSSYVTITTSPSKVLMIFVNSRIRSPRICSCIYLSGASSRSKLPLPFSSSRHIGQDGSRYLQSWMHSLQYAWKQVNTVSMVRSMQMQQMFRSEPTGCCSFLLYRALRMGSEIRSGLLTIVSFSSSSPMLLFIVFFFVALRKISFWPGVSNWFLEPRFINFAMLLNVSIFSRTWSKLLAPLRNCYTDLNLRR